MRKSKSPKFKMPKVREADITIVMKETQADNWIAINKRAFNAHNERVAISGTFLTPYWIEK